MTLNESVLSLMDRISADLDVNQSLVYEGRYHTLGSLPAFNATPHNEDEDALYPIEWVIPITVVYGIIFIFGLVGNVSTCIVIARNKSLHTVTNYYLFSIAISDLLLLISGLPPEMYRIWSPETYVFGEAFCVLQGFAAETSANATVLTITAFTVERYLAICHPFLSHTMSNLSRAIKYILGIWVGALCLAAPQAIQFGVEYEQKNGVELSRCTVVANGFFSHAFEISTFLIFVGPMTLITVLYILIAIKLNKSRMLRNSKQRRLSLASNAACSAVGGGGGGAVEAVGGTRASKKMQAQNRVIKMLELWVIQIIKEAAKEALGVKQRKAISNHRLTWNEKTEKQKTIKQAAYHTWLSTKKIEDKEKYRLELSKFKQMIRENEDSMWENKCKHIEMHLGGMRSQLAWKTLKALRTSDKQQVYMPLIKLNTWKEHYKKELTEFRDEYIELANRPIEVQGEKIQLTTDMFDKALKSMKNGKACGPEGIAVELIKAAPEELKELLRIIMENCINGDTLPLSWKEGWITPLHKKGNRTECNNYRCITVLSTLSKLYGRIIRNIVEEEWTPYEMEEQAGFRAGRTCMDNIFTINQVTEKKVATNREVHLMFVDLKKAYDTVPTQKLWEVLERTSINNTVIKAIKQLYNGAEAKIKVNGKFSSSFKITKGLRQGCTISPTLFKIYIQAALEQWKRSTQYMGIQISDETTLYSLNFADDQVIIAQDKEDLEYMARKLFQHYELWGLTVNMEKTEYLCVGGPKEDLILNDHRCIKATDEYKYLGTKINQSGRTEVEIQNRITKGQQVIRALNPVLWTRNISKKRKKTLFNAILKSIVLYGCESWQMTKQVEKQLTVLEMDFWRRSTGTSRREKVRNTRIKEIMDVQGSLVEDVQQSQLRWYGHVQRMARNRIPKMAMEWIPAEKRKRGRPKITWLSGILKAMSEKNLEAGDWENRARWNKGIGRRSML